MSKRLSGVELHLVDSFTEVENFLRWLSEDRNRQWLAVDLETGGLDWWREPIRTAQFGDVQHGWCIPFDRWGGLVEEVFTRVPHGTTRFVAHNAKFDAKFLVQNGFTIPAFDDTMAMVHLIESYKPKGLKAAAARRVDPRAASGAQELEQLMRKAKWTWRDIPWSVPQYWQYGALDTVLTAHLAADCWPEISTRYQDAYQLQVESDAVLLKMEMRGMKVDIQYCMQQQAQLEARLEELLEYFDKNFHIDPLSPQQLVKFFWEQGIEVAMTTERGAPSVKKESLEQIDHPLVELILDARKCQKMATTYFGNLLEFADSNGILHPDINPLGAMTGRQSIKRPALQTLPRTALIRDAFIPLPGHKMLLADYQGQEMRVFAAFCGDPEMIAAYRRGEDLHNFTAAKVYGPDFTKAQRQVAKNAGFAKIYGAGAAKFAATARIPFSEAERFLTMYDDLFKRVRPFQAEVVNKIMQRAHEAQSDMGYVTTLAGRRVYVGKKQAYKGVNYIVQGSCADVLRRGLVDLDNAGLADMGEDGGLVLPVHDEVAFDVKAEIVEDVAAAVIDVLQNASFGIKVPMIVEHEIVDRWGDKYR